MVIKGINLQFCINIKLLTILQYSRIKTYIYIAA